MTNNNKDDMESKIDGDAISKIASVSVGGSESTSTTTFTNQNPVNEVKVISNVPHEREIVNSATSGPVDQSIRSFMQKPYPIITGSITTSDLAGFLLFKFNIGPQLTNIPMWHDKTKGFMNVRGTAKVRLQLNANPFQAGRVILSYLPQYTDATNSGGMHQNSLVSITQQPHVEACFQDSECELEIPYISPTTHYNLLSTAFDWGTVFCYVYSPLAIGTGGTNQVVYTCWLSFDDFELATPIVPQSGGSKRNTKKDIIKKYRVNAIKSNIDSEVNEGKGPISSVLSNVSSIASTLYSVPMLAPIAGPVSWATNLMSGVASAFGWSKPILDTQVCRMYNNPHAYLANINESDLSNSLGLIQDNRVVVMPDVNLSGVDEMSHKFIKRQKAFFRSITWTTTTLPGPLDQFVVAPDIFSVAGSVIPLGATSKYHTTHHTPVSFLAKLYRQWRGSFDITIKVVKTQYHTGRLMLSFRMWTSAGTNISNTDSSYVHREVIDLRDGDEFCVTIPYCHSTMYQSTTNSEELIKGIFHINVLNELVAPDSVTQSVQLLVEVRGGEDLEFQVPVPFNMMPGLTISPQSGGMSDATKDPILCNNIGGSTIHDPSIMASRLCIGEHSTSILQLLKRYTRLSSDLVIGTSNKLLIYPFMWGGVFTNGLVSGGSTGPFMNDYLSLFAACYAHSRGGVRYRMIYDPVSESDTTSSSIMTNLEPFLPGTNVPAAFATAATTYQLGLNPVAIGSEAVVTNPTSVFDSSYNCGTAISVPMYNRTFTRLNRIVLNNGSGQIPTTPDTNLMWPSFVSLSSGFGSATSIYRCAADDFHFSFWIGVPEVGWVSTI